MSAPLKARLRAIVEALPSAKLLVLGDMVVDEYVFGQPVRVSREAPIPVLEFRSRRILPGGGANPATNACALGATVAVAGVIGGDAAGADLVHLLDTAGIQTDGLVIDPVRTTYKKTRIVAGDSQLFYQQVARIDHVDYGAVAGDVNDRFWRVLDVALPACDAVLISDYEWGVINPMILERCLPRARELGKLIAVDAHAALSRFRGITIATPNQPEAAEAVGYPIDGPGALERAGRALLAETGAEAVLITRGSDGIGLFARDSPTELLPAMPFGAVRDPTGAGDTVATVFALARVVGASYPEAALLANLAAGIVVSRLGVATCAPAELLAAIERWCSPTTGPATGETVPERHTLSHEGQGSSDTILTSAVPDAGRGE